MTYNNIIELFKRFADNHFFIKAFYEGEVPEITNDKKTEYPLLYPLYTGSTYSTHVENLNFEIYILDLPLTKEDKVEQQRNIVSDCKQVAEDIIADINNGGNIFVFDDQVEIVNSSITPAIDTQSNMLAGVILNLTIGIPYTANACIIPLTGVTPTSGACDVATYQNSDASFTQEIASGGSYTAADITITDVDGSTRNVPSNNNVTCAWSNISVRNSDGVVLATIAAYPSGGNEDLADIAIADTGVFSDTTPVPSSIEVSGTITSISANPSTGKLTINVPSVASGIIYQRPTWGGQSTSYATGDVGYHAANGSYDYTETGSTIQRLDYADANPFYILKENNAFGNKYRFTDSTGAQADDNLAAFDANNFVTNRPTAIPYYVIDHLTGLGWIIAKVGISQNWSTAITTANGYTDGTNSDYRLPSIEEFKSVINANSQWYQSVTIFERSNVIVSGTDVYLWTGNTDLISSSANAFRWMDVADIRRVGKTTTAAMGTFVVRNHY